MIIHVRRRCEAFRGRVPPDDEVQLRQLPFGLQPVHHEMCEGKGRPRGGPRANAGRAKYYGSWVTDDLEAIRAGCDTVVANRWSDELADAVEKAYTRDLFKRDLGRRAVDRLLQGITSEYDFRISPVPPGRINMQRYYYRILPSW